MEPPVSKLRGGKSHRSAGGFWGAAFVRVERDRKEPGGSCRRRQIPRMIARDSGIVINMGGGRPAAGSGYAVSKAGVAEFTRALTLELRQAQSRVSVFLADPGLVDTAMSRLHARNPIAETWASDLVDRMGRGDTRRPEEIAGKLVAQLPHMSFATSGGFFTPDTPTGSFDAIV